MFDFKKRLGQKASPHRIVEPIALYDTLDRESDKGPLRDAQKAVLTIWHEQRRNEAELILKMHTGQGKTLVGLLMLQSQLNAGKGPAVYLCPNHFLVGQTRREAERFGFKVDELEGDLPEDFIEARRILITIPQKLFNGETKFGLNARSYKVGTVLLDDAHAGVDIIREQFVIRLKHDQGGYDELRDLFAPDLEAQGAGTFAELKLNEYDAILPVPYWAWREKQAEVTNILVEHRETKSIRFAWPMLKDQLEKCACVFSGHSVEISPVIPPLHMFGSYAQAQHRIFMSATVANDAFLVKGLGMAADTVRRPLVNEKETWSGEKMILIPSLIDGTLDRSEIVNRLAKPHKKRPYGIVGLAPSFKKIADWDGLGAKIAKEDIDDLVNDLRSGRRDDVVVFVNRYDGIDLPDAACRILVFDSKPFAESLQDRYMERCVGETDALAMALARKIEQGLGRSVRGEKDFCVILVIGADLVKPLRAQESRRHLSGQTRKQIEIGLEVVEMAREGVNDVANPVAVLTKAMNLCLQRDEGWKDFYIQRMNELAPEPADVRMLEQFAQEREAELKFQMNDIDGARKIVQQLSDRAGTNENNKGWYIQEAARFEYERSKAESNTLQIAAHKRNRALLRPRSGMEFKRISLLSQKRLENLRKWISGHGTGKDLMVAVDAMLAGANFGVGAERFEASLHELGNALGFECERPDREWKEGPDNLWALRDRQYLLIECKSEVELTRAELRKDETDQMNRASAWFQKNYGDADVARVIIIPTKKVGGNAAFRDSVTVMREGRLKAFRSAVRGFFTEFVNLDLRDLASQRIQDFLNTHKLDVDSLISEYAEKPAVVRRPA